VAHHPQAEALSRRPLGDAFPVVLHFQREGAVYRMKANANLSRGGVFEGVGDAFLGNSEQLRGHLRGAVGRGSFGFEDEPHRPGGVETGGQILQRVRQSARFQADWGQSMRKATGFGNRFADLAGGFGGPGGAFGMAVKEGAQAI